jgi:pimeloyl-ACP methyl ester carboxylesterase
VIRWVESGRGEPVAVLDAAAAEPGSLAWAGVMPLVAARTRVIAYDRAGAGDSDPVAPLSLDGQIGDLTAVLQAAGGGRPVVVAGHSWGGLLAQLVALGHPELVAGLVLADPADENFLIHRKRASRTAWPWAKVFWPGTPAATWPAWCARCSGRTPGASPAIRRSRS